MTIPACPVAPRWQDLCDAIAPELARMVRAATSDAQGIIAKPGEVAGDLVTAADFALQSGLESLLTRLLPGSRFIGEEHFAAVTTLDPVFSWIVDPLDGTLNFASGLPFFGASIALVFGGDPVLGLVYDAGADLVYDAVHDGPARVGGQPFTWNSARAERAPVGISSGFLARMRQDPARFEPPWLGSRFRIFGAQAVQLCWAAMGALRVTINVEAKLWDDAAGALICRQAGAGYAALSAPLYPLQPGGPALSGQSLFSVAGQSDLVARARETFI